MKQLCINWRKPNRTAMRLSDNSNQFNKARLVGVFSSGVFECDQNPLVVTLGGDRSTLID